MFVLLAWSADASLCPTATCVPIEGFVHVIALPNLRSGDLMQIPFPFRLRRLPSPWPTLVLLSFPDHPVKIPRLLKSQGPSWIVLVLALCAFFFFFFRAITGWREDMPLCTSSLLRVFLFPRLTLRLFSLSSATETFSFAVGDHHPGCMSLNWVGWLIHVLSKRRSAYCPPGIPYSFCSAVALSKVPDLCLSHPTPFFYDPPMRGIPFYSLTVSPFGLTQLFAL